MNDQERIDNLTQQVAELAETVRDHATDRATLDMDALGQTFGKLFDERVSALLEQQRKNAPVRRMEDVLDIEPATGPSANRYDFMLARKQLRASDLIIAHDFMKSLAEAGAPVRPSKDLEGAYQKLMGASGYGAEIAAPTAMANEVWQDVFLESRVAGLLMPVNMTSDPYDMLNVGELAFRKGSSGSAVAGQNLETSRPRLTTNEFVADVEWPYDLNEDAVIAMTPLIRQIMTRAGAEAADDFCLNADATATSTGNINSDNATPPTDALYLAEGQDGIRHLWLVDNTGQGVSGGGDAIATADMTGALKKLDKYFDPDRCVFVCDPITAVNIMGISELLTVDKYGTGARILTGEVGSYMRTPIIVSAEHPRVEADGKVGASNTLGSVSLFRTDMWAKGTRRELLIEAAKDIRSRTFFMVASFRLAVGAWGTRSSAEHTAGIYNVL